MYRFKRVNITTLHDKTIRGASEFLESEKLDSANIVYQIGSNDLEESEPEEVADSMEKLQLDTQRLLPESRIIISEILPRFYKNQVSRRNYERKRVECNQLIFNLCDRY